MPTRLGAFSAALVVIVLAGTGLTAASASALPVPAAATSVSAAEADLLYVRYIAATDPRELVRVAARTAIISSAQERAIAQFLTNGFDSAKARAADTKARNLDFAKRVLRCTVPEVSPEVYAAAMYAIGHTDADRARFAETGYAAAKERDRLAREAGGAQARALMQIDRDFVAKLRTDDPGEQVRVSAAWALRTGSDDADIVEFFAYGWLNGASLDLETHRIRLTDSDIAWRNTVSRLVAEAQDAERAAIDAADESSEQARAAAARTWQAVGDNTATPRTAWSNAEAVALAQAANWHQVAAAALAAGGSPVWQPILVPATANADEWTLEQDNAAAQASYWRALLEQAMAGEARMAATA